MSQTLQERIEQRIVDLEFQKEAIDAKIEELRGLLEPQDNHEHDAGNDHPPARPRRARSAEPGENGSGPGETAQRIAALLREGPLQTKAICDQLAISNPTILYQAKRSGLFAKSDPDNRLSPWQLTEAGRAAANDASYDRSEPSRLD